MLDTFLGKNWAMPVTRKRWAAATVVLHRLQRLTVRLPGHRVIRRAECAAFSRSHG